MFAWLGRMLRRDASRAVLGPGQPADDSLGVRSEQLARAFLERAGFHILAANYRCPLGEIDLIAEGDARLVFVEVKARCLDAARGARPEQAVNHRKRRKIGRAAKYFCRANRRTDAIVRFDVIAIDWPASGEPAVRHMVAAFRPGV